VGLVVSAGGAGVESLPPFDAGALLSQWGIAPLPLIITVWATGLYAVGVLTLRRRGDDWPVGRSLAWGVGMLAFYLATSSGLAAYDTVLLSAHMVQHMILSMIVPLSLPRRPRGWLLALLHSRLAKVLGFPPLTFGLYVISPWALYFSGWYEASLRSTYVHEMMHVHLVVVGALFFWPIVGVDPLPGRVGHPFRVLLTVMTLPFHAFLGVTIMGQSTLLGGDWYPSLHDGPLGAWLPDPYDDQKLAGGILWGAGDLVGLVFFVVLFAQWVRSSMKEAEREDRRLDRLERQGQRAATEVTPADPAPSE